MPSTTALITGSTSGIGLGLAKAFAERGYNIIFNGLEPNAAEIARQVATDYNIHHIFSAVDMLDVHGLRELVQQAIARFNTVDILINNAGVQYVSPVDTFPDEEWDRVIAVNLTAPFVMTKAVWPHMKKNNFGRIINISSIHGLFASEYKSAYVASKHGLVGFTKTAALEGAPFNITCNAICPAYVKTPLVEKQINAQAHQHQREPSEIIDQYFLNKQAVKQFIPIQQIAELALYLAMPGNSSVTGTAFPIDGGWSAQ